MRGSLHSWQFSIGTTNNQIAAPEESLQPLPQIGYFEGIWFGFLAFPPGSYESFGFWAGLDQSSVKPSVYLVYSDPSEWCPWCAHTSPAWSQTRGSYIPDVVHPGYGCAEQLVRQSRWGRAAASFGQQIGSSESVYADDVALFIRPMEEELLMSKQILDCFGKASGLQTNLNKSCAISIGCEGEPLEVVQDILHCPTSSFPSTYLGLPISNRQLRKSDFLPRIEKIANRLPGWKAHLMNLAGRATMVWFVLSANLVYLFIAMSVPKWVIKAIDKIRRAFLWKGRKEINGGSCLVAWEKVARHINLGGLGIPNLHVWSWALQMRCLWFQKTIPSKPWVGLEIPEHFNSKNLYANALLSHVGNGSNTLF